MKIIGYKDKHEYINENGVTSVVYLMDCMELLKQVPEKYFQLAVVDPPYGQNAMDGSRTRKKYGINRSDNWDCYRPNEEYFSKLMGASKNQIIWGGNYFISNLIDTKCFIIWDKKIAEGMNNYAMCEMAWTSFSGRPAKLYSKIAAQKDRIHPTQKPIGLYDFTFRHFAEVGDKILDTHLGSGNSRIAADKANLPFMGCELDSDYFYASVNRFKEYSAQQTMF